MKLEIGDKFIDDFGNKIEIVSLDNYRGGKTAGVIEVSPGGSVYSYYRYQKEFKKFKKIHNEPSRKSY